ncbi:MAG TPA: hypothetical protein VJ729_02245 [Nitrososphaeraceae archaeon]|nr:hypothetical protein [Nitrososphaeraceae archaeon]
MTKITAIKSVLSLMLVLMLSIIIMTGANSFHIALAQPMMLGGNSVGMGNDGSPAMDFNNPMSFANKIFNASSLYGSVGISMVKGVKVTSINLLENNEISVTLRHSPAAAAAAADTSDNSISAATTSAPTPPPAPPSRVTVTAIRAPLNLKDLISLAAAQSSRTGGNMSNTMSNSMMMGGGGPMQAFGGAGAAAAGGDNNSTNQFNPMAFLTGLQIGSSSTVANADWKLPQTVRMGLTNMLGNNSNNSTAASTADFIIVSVIPYTGTSTTTNPLS